MHIKDALELWLDEQAVAIQGKTFDPISIEEVKLNTGERMYWMRNSEDLWISVDPESEELMLFHDLEEEIEVDADHAMHNGQDFECSYECEGKIMDGEEELDKVSVREYEGPGGQVLRVIEYIVGGDHVFALGQTIPEEELTFVD